MPIVQAWPVDAFGLPFGADLIPEQVEIIDVNNDGQIGPGDTVNGEVITQNYIGDTITVDDGTPPDTVVEGTTLYTDAGSRFFLDLATGGAPPLQTGTAVTSTFVNNGNQTFPIGDLGPPCFVAGTLIRTPSGEVPVETLTAGDMVLTLDNGPQPLRWIGITRTHGQGNYAPIRFEAGAYGAERRMLLSPQHRVLLDGPQAELLFGASELLVAAKHLVDGDQVRVEPCAAVDYVHLLFDRHEIVFADGMACESFHPGEVGLGALEASAREELLSLFPQLKTGWESYGAAARQSLRSYEAGVFAHASG